MKLIDREKFTKKFEVASEKQDTLTTKTYSFGGIQGAKTVNANFVMNKYKEDYLSLKHIEIVSSSNNMPSYGKRHKAAFGQIMNHILTQDFVIPYFDEENFYIGGTWDGNDTFIYNFADIRPFIDKDELKIIAAIFENVNDESEQDLTEACSIFYFHPKQKKIYRENRMMMYDRFKEEKMGNSLSFVFEKIYYTKDREPLELICDLNKEDFDSCHVNYHGTISFEHRRELWSGSYSFNELAVEKPNVLDDAIIKGKPNDRFISKIRGGIGVCMEIYDEVALGKTKKDFNVGDWVMYDNSLARVFIANPQTRSYSIIPYGSYDHIGMYTGSPAPLELSDAVLNPVSGPESTETRLVKVDLRPQYNFIGFGQLIETHNDISKIRLVSKFSEPTQIAKALVSRSTKRDYYFDQTINPTIFGGMDVIFAKRKQVSEIDGAEETKVTRYLEGKVNQAEEALYSLFKLGGVNINADYFLMDLMKYSSVFQWFDIVNDISVALNEKEGHKRIENMEELLSGLERRKKIQKLKVAK